jgi:preprotein translocase subunit SecG
MGNVTLTSSSAQLILLQSTSDLLARSTGLAGAMFGVASLIMSTGLLQKYNGAEQLHATDAVRLFCRKPVNNTH